MCISSQIGSSSRIAVGVYRNQFTLRGSPSGSIKGSLLLVNVSLDLKSGQGRQMGTAGMDEGRTRRCHGCAHVSEAFDFVGPPRIL